MTKVTHRPTEAVLWGGAVNLIGAGITDDDFIPNAPLCGCRLCGALLQTKLHRELYHIRQEGLPDPPELLAKVLDIGNKWRQRHFERNHHQDEVVALDALGWAFMPSAAHKLAPFGIAPLGNMHKDIADAMFDAPRAPDLEVLNATC